ncbi:MAG: glycosyltransferase family 1 protein [Deltaproteobacteria bacterium]|nr:glycosyltransferase family 1 protein [Deltaproteobacteria bacterium]
MKGKHRLCYVVSSEMTVSAFLANHIGTAASEYDVTVVVNTANADFMKDMNLPARLKMIPIERRISPLRDLFALTKLVILFYREGFDIVHSVSPKAGLLAMLSAWLAKVPCRIHTFTGQVWAVRQGWRRKVLKGIDRVLAALTSTALVDSPSQRSFLISEGVLLEGKSSVIGSGSISGVDGVRFRTDVQARHEVRDALGIAESETLLLFLGRLTRDKGVLDLATAFQRIGRRFPDAQLMLVGPDEDELMPEILRICSEVGDRVRHADFTREPERYMAAADIFCLPSYREGFGTVIIEAAATGIPAVASRIYGITDAVVESSTGLLHRPGNVDEIEAALSQLIADPAKRIAMGNEARRRALTEFSQAESSRELMAFYGKMIGYRIDS